MHHAAQSMLFTLAFLATVLYSVKAQTIIIPDCSSGNGSPTCVNGGTVINVASVSKK